MGLEPESDIEKYWSVAVGEQATFFERGVLDALYMLNAESALSRPTMFKCSPIIPLSFFCRRGKTFTVQIQSVIKRSRSPSRYSRG